MNSIRTRFFDPIQPAEVCRATLLREYPYRDRVVRLFWDFQNTKYGVFSQDGQQLAAAHPLEVEGIPDLAKHSAGLERFLQRSFAKVTEFSSGEYKLSVCQRIEGGGWGEMAVGAVVVAGGVGIAALGAPVLLPVSLAAAAPAVLTPLAAGTAMGAGASMVATGYGREEDRFDGQFAKDALKGAASGAVTGLMGGGAGGAIVRRVGARTVLARQSIHAVTNAAGGVLRNVVEAKADEHFGGERGKERARERLSGRSLLASAAGGAAGGLAGAHVGKQAAQISNGLARAAATSLGGAVAGGAAGAAGGAVSVAAVNVYEGEEVTRGLRSAAANGASTGMIVGSIAANRVGAKYFQLKEEEIVRNQAVNFQEEGIVQINTAQKARLSSYLRAELEELRKTEGLLRSLRAEGLRDAQRRIRQVEGLMARVQGEVLTRDDLLFVNELNGLSTLNNPDLAISVLQSVEEPPPPISSGGKGGGGMVEGPRFRRESPPVDSERPVRRDFRERIQRSMGQVERERPSPAPHSGPEEAATSPLRRSQELVQRKIEVLNGLQEEVRTSPQLVAEVQREIHYQTLVGQSLENPSETALRILEEARRLGEGQSLMIPAGEGQGATFLYKQGTKVYPLNGDSAQELLRQTPESLPEFLRGRAGISIESQERMGDLFAQIQQSTEQVQREALQQANSAVAAAPQGQQQNPLALFNPFERARLEGILNRLEEMLNDMVPRDVLQQWSADLDVQNADLAAQLQSLQNL